MVSISMNLGIILVFCRFYVKSVCFFSMFGLIV